MSNKDEIISAFAYETGRKIEELIIEQTNNLEEANKQLEAKILHWHLISGKDPEYAEYFGIKEAKEGIIER